MGLDLTIIYSELNILLEEPRLRRLYIAVRSAFLAQKAIGHNWEHIRRDIINAVYIGLHEKADMGIVMPSIILHDIGYVMNPRDPSRHAQIGAIECLPFLAEWTNPEKKLISECILRHKGKYPGYEHLEPQSLEEKIVCDADQVDKFGWVGVMQVLKVYIEYGENGIEKYRSLNGLKDGVSHLANIKLYTETARVLVSHLNGPDWSVIHEEVSKELKNYDWKEPI